jgi:hypothetical protein
MKRSLLVALVAILCTFSVSAQSYRPSTEVGSETITPTTSTALTVPTGTQWITFTVRSAGVHVSFDASAATTSDLYLPPGVYKIENDYRLIPLLRFIDSSDGASTVYVKYFAAR